MNDPQARPTLRSLPLEILHMIIWQLEQDYIDTHSSGIFNVMRANRLFRDMAFAAHFKKTDYRLINGELVHTTGSKKNNTENNRDKNVPSQDQIYLMLWDERWARQWERLSRKNVRGWTQSRQFVCRCADEPAPAPAPVPQLLHGQQQTISWLGSQRRCNSAEECAQRRSGCAVAGLSAAASSFGVSSSTT